jgi:hypothetical protein
MAGVTDQDINCDDAENVGKNIVKKMIGSVVTEYSFNRKNHVVTMSMKAKDSSKQDRVTPIDS